MRLDSVLKTQAKGSTLLEVLVVIAVIGMLAAIAFPSYFSYLERARSAACLANRETINKEIAASVAAGKEPPASLSDFGYPESLCPSGGVYVLIPAGEGRAAPTVACSIHHWSKVDTPTSSYPKKISLTGFDDFIVVGSGWELTQDGIMVRGGRGSTDGSNRLFIPNPLGDGSYSIIAEASLYSGDNGGYGIFFDTVVDGQGNVSSGYILQFDRGLGTGALIIREWSNNRESNVPPGGLFNDPAVIPQKTDDPDWWTSPKEIRLDVTDSGDGTKKLRVYLDGTLTFDDWEFGGSSGQETFTGFRGWHSPYAEFTDLSIDTP
jgi:prepilin-type N-terminal cleavage/methylation domain-containing protein